MYFISILYVKQITGVFPTLKVKLYSLKFIWKNDANAVARKYCPLFIVSNKKYDKWHPLRGGHVWRAATVVSLALTKIETWSEMSVSLYAHIDYQITVLLCIIRQMYIDSMPFKNILNLNFNEDGNEVLHNS